MFFVIRRFIFSLLSSLTLCKSLSFIWMQWFQTSWGSFGLDGSFASSFDKYNDSTTQVDSSMATLTALRQWISTFLRGFYSSLD